MPEDPTVAVVGMGYVGCCTAATLADRGLDVVGVDVNTTLVDNLTHGRLHLDEPGLAEMIQAATAARRLRYTTDFAAVSACDVIVIAVGTPIAEDGSLDDRQLRDACLALREHLRPGHLVVVKSTVPPGTTRGLVAALLAGEQRRAGVDYLLAFSPERLAESTALDDLRRFPIVVGGIDERSTRAAERFWRRGIGVDVLAQDSLETAEIVKLADNWWIDLNIALANDLAKFCALYDVDVLDVIAAANTIPKGKGHVNILLPGVGVGGSCLTKDPWMVWRAARHRGVELHTTRVGREVNDAMPAYTAQMIIDELGALGRDPGTATVTILGVAFKNNTGDLRSSPVVGVVEKLVKAGVQVRVHDPLVDPAQVRKLLGVHPDATVAEAVRDADCVAVLALHDAYREIDFAGLPVARPCVVVDGRAYYPKEKIAMLRQLGYRYRGVGR
ncbi:nucleotide sugar dehydrogenase [Micromonospora sp. NPDC048999]|uniref:nucleotide sugar dehydrogenase n=1 Tax=Micromonospora sp. NPDC048999 TaxID=3155391 RepID=UPI0033FDA5FF